MGLPRQFVSSSDVHFLLRAPTQWWRSFKASWRIGILGAGIHGVVFVVGFCFGSGRSLPTNI